jgi:hypothetical protein
MALAKTTTFLTGKLIALTRYIGFLHPIYPEVVC